MIKLKNYLITSLKRIDHKVRPRQHTARFLHKNVTYFSQWESRELNSQILSHDIDTKDDPKWELSGANSKEEYAKWSWSACGMACTKMVLAHKTGKVIPIVKLGKKCAEYGGYTYPIEQSKGLIYRPYINFMEKEYGVASKLVMPLILEEIISELSSESYVIASVSPEIREPEKTPKSRGGHLILMLGYDIDKKELYFHNPSGISVSTQEYATISFDNFQKFFSGRGITIKF